MDCQIALRQVSNYGEVENEVVLTDPEIEGECDAIHAQCLQMMYEPNYWVNTIWVWAKSVFWHQQQEIITKTFPDRCILVQLVP